MNKKNKINCLSLLVTLFVFLLPNLSYATIFKCINKNGETYYNDKPCPVNAKETKLKNIKDPKSKYIPKPFVEKKEAFVAKGIVVGKESTKNIDSIGKDKKRKNEKFSAKESSNKTQDSNHESTTQSSASSPSPFPEGSDLKIPTVQEELKSFLDKHHVQGKASGQQQLLSEMVN